MKISLSNPGSWLRCLFEFIFFFMRVFYYGNATLDKNSLGWKSNGFFTGKRRKIRGRGSGYHQISLIKHRGKLNIMDKTMGDTQSCAQLGKKVFLCVILPDSSTQSQPDFGNAYLSCLSVYSLHSQVVLQPRAYFKYSGLGRHSFPGSPKSLL